MPSKDCWDYIKKRYKGTVCVFYMKPECLIENSLSLRNSNISHLLICGDSSQLLNLVISCKDFTADNVHVECTVENYYQLSIITSNTNYTQLT